MAGAGILPDSGSLAFCVSNPACKFSLLNNLVLFKTTPPLHCLSGCSVGVTRTVLDAHQRRYRNVSYHKTPLDMTFYARAETRFLTKQTISLLYNDILTGDNIMKQREIRRQRLIKEIIKRRLLSALIADRKEHKNNFAHLQSANRRG